jgi:fatty-acyl-CoA synthase
MTASSPISDARQTLKRSANRDWLRALQNTAAIEKNPREILGRAFDAAAARRADATAVVDERERVSFAEFCARANRMSRWALQENLRKGEVVALAMGNCVDYAAIWLGLTRVGVVVALANVNLAPPALAHCLRVAKAARVIAAPAFAKSCEEAVALLEAPIEVSTYGVETDLHARLTQISSQPLRDDEERDVTILDPALYIYTSGTTGLPKAAVVTHRRLMHWAHWFAGLADMGPGDRMFNCLPMYHSVGGVVAVFAPLLAGGSVVLRARFSASNFWADVVAERCTMFQYIGELCRYLLQASEDGATPRHALRIAIGNGLRGDVWEPFQTRFAIPRILEFYAATESNFSLYNVEGEPGAIGRIPPFLGQSAQIFLVAHDEETGLPKRDGAGRCIPCKADEAGEAMARIETNDGGRGAFEGYVGAAENEKKILRDVLEQGDAFMRSGDLMRKDTRGFFYFVDRIGDSFRWKGENVSTLEVAEVLLRAPGVLDANVYGVDVPGHEGRAGMAALVVGEDFELERLRLHLEQSLPAYARPLFLRIGRTLAVTETFKHKKKDLVDAGFDPARTADSLYFAPAGATYLALDAEIFDRICAREIRL